jgi:hypothetical protein
MPQSRININTLQRAASDDINTLQKLAERLAAEFAATSARMVQGDEYTVAPTSTLRTGVCSGLMGTPTATPSVVVSPGLLAQSVAANPPSVPAATADESAYRIAIQQASVDVGDPWDATTKYWLLQARVVISTTTGNPDIYDTTTKTFSPSGAALDIRYDSEIEYLFKAGTATTLPTPDTGYTPILSLYRPLAGGVISQFDIIPLALQYEDIVAPLTATNRCERKNFTFHSSDGFGRDALNCVFHLEAEVGGYRCFARTTTGVPLHSTIFVEASSVAALAIDGVWGYIYLAPGPSGEMPRTSTGFPGLEMVGILVISRTPPDIHGLNTAAITAPDPYGYTLPAGSAAHVGLIRSKGGLPVDYSITVTAAGVGRIDSSRKLINDTLIMNAANSFGQIGSPWNLATAGASGTEDIPYGVKEVKCYIQHRTLDDTATAKAIETTFGLGPVITGDDTTSPDSMSPRILMDTDTIISKEFSIWPRDDLTLRITFVPRDANLIDTGGGAADGGTTEFNTGMCGFVF